MQIPHFFFCEEPDPSMNRNAYSGDNIADGNVSIRQIYQVTYTMKHGRALFKNVNHSLYPYPNHDITLERQTDLFGNDSETSQLGLVLAHINIQSTDVIAWTLHQAKKPRQASTMVILVRKSLQDPTPLQKEYLELVEMVQTETERMKAKIREAFLLASNEKESKAVIHNKYHTIWNLYRNLLVKSKVTMDSLFKPPLRYDTNEKLLLSLHYIDHLLVFIATEYHPYMPQNAMVPLTILMDERKKTASASNRVLTTLSELFPETQYNIFSEPIARLHNAVARPKISYSELRYCQAFITSLDSAIKSGTQETELVYRTMIELNLNTRAFMNHYIEYLQKRIAEVDTSETVIRLILEFQKDLRQVLCREVSYDPDLPSVKDYLLEWLNAELNFWERVSPSEVFAHRYITKRENSKIAVGVSVAKLTLLFSLLMEVKVLLTESKTQLFRFIAENFRTEHTDNISYKSVSTKCYEPDNTSIEGVSELLEVMREQLKKR